MRRCQDHSLVYYQFENLSSQEHVCHAVFTRLGGTSLPPYDTLNLGRSVGDTEQAVHENYARICRELGISIASLVTGYQVHSDVVAVVGPNERGNILPTTDALVTDSAAIGLTLRFADCVPVLFYDPCRRVIGIAHAGWKGTVDKICNKVIATFETVFGSRPADIIAGIGPAIGPCCYQVGEDVVRRVEEAFPYAGDLLLPQADGSVHFDLWAANRRQLEDVGITTIEEARMCTSCRHDEFFSHRANHGKTGRFGAFIALGREYIE